MKGINKAFNDSKNYIKESMNEIYTECFPSELFRSSDAIGHIGTYAKDIFHVPYSPAFSRPGWLVSLVTGPKDSKFYEQLYGDVFAGFTVGMTLIPQALSYAALAGLPPVNGLYAVILPIAVYSVLGSSMQLGVGPVALVSLLMAELVTKYELSITIDAAEVVDFAAQACFCSGILMLLMGLFNLGNLIRFISYPVMAGFTTASAMIIGLNQIKNGFGFSSNAGVPQAGGEVHYNYEVMEWYIEHWNGRDSRGYLFRNVHATNITFGLYVPLICLWFFKRNWKPAEKTKKTALYQAFNYFTTITTLLGLIIAAHMAYRIHNFNTTHHARALKVVGTVPPGLDIFRIPQFRQPMGQLFVDVIPLTIISYMESFAVARKCAASKGQLSFLNASQELVALGIGNMLNCVSSGYTVAGSFSRSSLYSSCGSNTQIAHLTTLIIILIAVGTLTKAFYFIPQAALSAIVMVAVAGLIDFHEFWVAWKLSKKDFFVMFATFIFTFVYDTEIGLGVGIGVSIVMLLKDLAYSLEAKPISTAFSVNGVQIIRLNSNLVFVSATTIKDTLINEIFDKSTELRAVVLDFVDVKHVDLSGLFAMKEVMVAAKKAQIFVFVSNALPEVSVLLSRVEVIGADLETCPEELRDAVAAARALSGNNVMADSLNEESLGLVSSLLRSSQPRSMLEMARWSVVQGSNGVEVRERDLDNEGMELARHSTTTTSRTVVTGAFIVEEEETKENSYDFPVDASLSSASSERDQQQQHQYQQLEDGSLGEHSNNRM